MILKITTLIFLFVGVAHAGPTKTNSQYLVRLPTRYLQNGRVNGEPISRIGHSSRRDVSELAQKYNGNNNHVENGENEEVPEPGSLPGDVVHHSVEYEYFYVPKPVPVDEHGRVIPGIDLSNVNLQSLGINAQNGQAEIAGGSGHGASAGHSQHQVVNNHQHVQSQQTIRHLGGQDFNQQHIQLPQSTLTQSPVSQFTGQSFQAAHQFQSNLGNGIQSTNLNSFAGNLGGVHQTSPPIDFAPVQPIIQKHVYVHVPPPEPEEPIPTPSYGGSQPVKHYKIIFIKAPSSSTLRQQQIVAAQAAQEKTLIYVLSKKESDEINANVPLAAQVPPSKPEVYFIRYKTKNQVAELPSSGLNIAGTLEPPLSASAPEDSGAIGTTGHENTEHHNYGYSPEPRHGDSFHNEHEAEVAEIEQKHHGENESQSSTSFSLLKRSNLLKRALSRVV